MLGKITTSAVLALGLTACVTTAPAGQVDRSPISLEERFYQVAFYNEEVGKEFPLLRWEQPLVVNIKGGTEADHAKVRQIAEQLAEATGLPLSYESAAEGGISVQFLDDDRWQAFVARLAKKQASEGATTTGAGLQCYAQRYALAGGKAYVIARIPASHDDALKAHCIAQEVAHATGLHYDTPNRADTVFGDSAGADHLTDVDRQLLRILYDPRLQPGMTWAEAQPIVRQIIAEIEGG